MTAVELILAERWIKNFMINLTIRD